MVNYHIRDTGHKDSLKIEISYRNLPPEEQVSIKNGIRVASIERITDNKLNAAFDGDNTRTKGRDLFDLHFIAKNYGCILSLSILERLKTFAQDPDKLVSAYSEDIQADPLLNKIMDVETVSLELNELSKDLYSSILLQEISTEQMMKSIFQPFPDDLLNRRTENKSKTENEIRVNLIKMRIR